MVAIVIFIFTVHAVVFIILAAKYMVNKHQRRKLLSEILSDLHLENIDSLLSEYNHLITVKSQKPESKLKTVYPHS